MNSWAKAAFVLSIAGFGTSRGSSQENKSAPVPVLVELFTSDGCSSCPPADKLIAQIDRQQPVPGAKVIVVSEHVDYWNRPEWSDPNSSPLFTNRQTSYVSRFRIPEAYTPEAVIDGQKQVVGNQAKDVLSAIQSCSQTHKTELALSIAARSKASVTLDVSATGEAPGDLIAFAAYKTVEVHVAGGENAGRNLAHDSVAYSLKQVRKWSAKSKGPYKLKLPIKTGSDDAVGTRIIVLIQEPETGRVTALGSLDIS